ncbi:MAG: YjbH domain-containing protein [Chlamydiae bacterium]|nr:YjbH domain-containing protein [Chlamydiota bacterium]
MKINPTLSFLLSLSFHLCSSEMLTIQDPIYPNSDSQLSLFNDLSLVEKINKEINDRLPTYYNSSGIVGYFNMPSARMNKEGTVSFTGGYVSPYTVYALNIQAMDRVELAANYYVYTGITEANFGNQGYGDDADRIGNIKIGVLTPADGFPDLPLISVGAIDFIGTKRFNSQYVVATKSWLKANLEFSLGWGNGRMKGLFGGVSWTPFRNCPYWFIKDFSIVAEYDDINYKKHPYEHPSGTKVKSRLNGGINWLIGDTFQLSVASVRGDDLFATGSLRMPLGTYPGIFPKIDDPTPYQTPIDTEPLGKDRSEAEFAREMAFALGDQGLDLYSAYVYFDAAGGKHLWMKIVNNRYRVNEVVRERVQNVLAALMPADIVTTSIVVEADALPCQAYVYRTEDLYRLRKGQISVFEVETLAPMVEAPSAPSEFDAIKIYQRRKEIWVFTLKPRFIGFFGSASGKFKYNLSAVASQEGYLFEEIFYKLQGSYSLLGSTAGMRGVDKLNPSHMLVVRSDSVKYFQANSLHLEQAYLQKSWNMGKGTFFRMASGFFETAYAGGASEFLYYPAGSMFAIGLESAVVWKRHYDGVGFFHKIPKYDGTKVTYHKFTGFQYFLDLYYDFQPLCLDFKIKAGQFLARDKGVKFEVGKYFASGMRFSLWYSITNANEKINGRKYHDKGFSFLIPLDMFLKQSSRNYIGYAMAAWLRDQAASAATGKPLKATLYEERVQLP